MKTWSWSKYVTATSDAVDSSGNIYVAGYLTNSTPGIPDHYSVLLLKYNSSGSLQWVRSWGGIYDDLGYGVAVDYSGNVYVTGETASYNSGGSCQAVYNPSGFEPCPDLFIIKFDSNGSLLWQRNLGGNESDVGEGVAVDASNNIYVGGYTDSLPCISGCPVHHAILVKFNSTGSMLWQRYFGDKPPDVCCVSAPFSGVGVSVDLSTGSVYLAGNYISSGFLFIAKYNSTGGLVWQEAGGNGAVRSSARGIAVDSMSHNIYVTGRYQTCNCIESYGLIIKADPSGNLLWKKRWGSGGSGYDLGNSIATSPSGHIYVAGAQQGYGPHGVSVLSFDPSGVLQSRFQWGYVGDEGTGVVVDAAGNALVAGQTNGPYTASAGLGNDTLGTPIFSLFSSGAHSGDSAFSLATPTGGTATPSGVEDSGSSTEGTFLLNYKPPPSVLLPCSSMVCSILSDSPISNPGYLQSNQTLYFTVTGDAGTNDTVTVIIPKSLVAGQSGADFRVYAEGGVRNSWGLDANSTDFLVYITLTFHSPVYVSLYLGSSASSLPVALPLVALLLLVPFVRHRQRIRR